MAKANLPPSYQKDAVMDSRGWRHPRTGELLVAKKFSDSAIAIYYKSSVSYDDETSVVEVSTTPAVMVNDEKRDELVAEIVDTISVSTSGIAAVDENVIVTDFEIKSVDVIAPVPGGHMSGYIPSVKEEWTKDEIAAWAMKYYDLKVSVNKSKDKMLAQIKAHLSKDK